MLEAISRVLFWTYSRGSWQYDILCGLILCFIFLTPRTVFDGSAFAPLPQDRIEIQRAQSEATDETESEASERTGEQPTGSPSSH